MRQGVEYVAAVNNATSARTVTVDTWSSSFTKVYGQGGATGGGRLTITVPPLSATVFRAAAPVPPGAAPAVALT